MSGHVTSKPQFYIQLIYKAPLSLTLRVKIWVVAYFDPKEFKKKIYEKLIVQRFSAYAKGQLISKAIYGVLDSPKKMNKKIWLDVS